MPARARASDDLLEQLESVAKVVDGLLDEESWLTVLGEEIVRLVQPAVGRGQVTPSAVVRLALLNDCLRVAESAMQAYGELSSAEVMYAWPLAATAARYLATLRSAYGDYKDLTLGCAREFLEVHAADRQPFGGSCPRTEWQGFEICRAADVLRGNHGVLEDYHRLMLRVIEDVFALGTGSDEERCAQRDLEALVQLKARLAQSPSKASLGTDGRLRAFLSTSGPEVFHATAHASIADLVVSSTEMTSPADGRVAGTGADNVIQLSSFRKAGPGM